MPPLLDDRLLLPPYPPPDSPPILAPLVPEMINHKSCEAKTGGLEPVVRYKNLPIDILKLVINRDDGCPMVNLR